MSAAAKTSESVRRFWTARDAELRLDAGYLADPEGKYAAFLGVSQVVSLETLDDIPCVVLLGEPGSGKTTSLQSEVARLAAEGTRDGELTDVVLAVNLQNYQELGDLHAMVFEHPEVLRWKSGAHRLTLAFDSLDEALIEMKKLSSRLASELRALPHERLRVRIACRTADWPSLLEHELGAIWGEERVRVMEIAPLRRRDVLEIVTARMGEECAEPFMDAVAEQDAEPFAAKPGTLDFLISSFEASGRLPTSQAELYAIGCRALCEETSESRRSARRAGELSADQRLAIAERVAAAMIFGGRIAVWTGVDRAAPRTDLRVADLVGDEPTPTGVVHINEPVLRDEVLATGLFTARGRERLGWAHQTYGEYLAARWVKRRGLSREQVLALLTMEDHVGRKLVPQLHEVAAWVASLETEFFPAILDVEPWVLLRSDVARADAESRVRLVDALLDTARRNMLPRPELGQMRWYRKLEHPELGEQLRAVISNAAEPDRVRDLALDIATACRVSAVAQAAADIALDSSVKLGLRAAAAHAVAATKDEAAAARLRPLASEAIPEDERDELKGYALRAMWQTLSPAELFSLLSDAKVSNWGGSYAYLHHEIAESLRDEHVEPGLAWIIRNGRGGSSSQQRLATALILRAFDLSDKPQVLKQLACLTRRSILRYEDLLEDRDEQELLATKLADPTIRQRLLMALVDTVVARAAAGREATANEAGAPMPPEATIRRAIDSFQLMQSGYVTSDDFQFVLDSLIATGDAACHEHHRLAWGVLARDLLDMRRADQTDAVLERAAHPLVHRVFADLIESVDLQGAAATAARQQEREQEAMRARWTTRQAKRAEKDAEKAVEAPPPPSAARLAQAVHVEPDADRIGDLPLKRWWKVYLELVREESGEVPSHGRHADVRGGVAWRDAGPDLRGHVLAAATTFIESAEAPKLERGQIVRFHRYAWAGYVALRLLSAADPRRLDGVTTYAWKRWAPTVALAEPESNGLEEHEAHVVLARRARASAQEQFDAAVLSAVDDAIETNRWPIPAITLSAFATTALGDTVLARVQYAVEHDIAEAVTDQTTTSSDHTEATEGTPPARESPNDRLVRAQARDARRMTLVLLLVSLLEGGSQAVRAALVTSLTDTAASVPVDLESPGVERMFLAAHALLVGAGDAGWDVISPIISADPDFARELFLRAAVHREVPIKDFRERLGIRGVGELYVALVKAFPYETDVWHTGVFSPSARDNAETWRREMLNALEHWGVPEAIAELRRIQAALPQYEWLAGSVARAREEQGRAAWCPLSPAELFALADDRRRRLVRDSDQLLDLVVESLGRYQRELKGDLPAVVDLWDYSSKTSPRPRDEGHFADHIARFLRKDLEGRGVAVGCELVVRRGGRGRAPGLRTDIYVSAVISAQGAPDRTDGEIASVVIEVKGSWHPQVLAAMRTQLVEDYLQKHASTQRGIYLVGDFTSSAWTGEESRRSRALGGDVALRAKLDGQAEELSVEGVRVQAVVLDASLPS